MVLDLTHLPPEQLAAKLPDITEFARTYLGIEPYTEPVPSQPTAHYAMGGIPTTVGAEVLRNNTEVVPGLYAAGEVACVSVHGAVSPRLSGAPAAKLVALVALRYRRNASGYACHVMRCFRRIPAVLAALAAVACGGLALSATPPAAAAAAAAPSEPIGGPLLTGVGVVAKPSPGVPPPPVVAVASYVVADLDSGDVLAAKAPHLRLPPASTLKILTAHTLLPRINPNAVHVGTRDDESVDGTRVGMVTGQRYRAEELWHGLLLASGNDAANALASMAGGVPEALRLMQEEARRLQANDTLPSTPSGLDSDTGPGPFSSAYDLALITRAALQNKQFARYVSTKTARFPGKLGKAGFQISNQNQLLWGYPGAIGVKTGFTHKARNTFVGAANRNGHRLVAVLLLRVTGKRGIQQDGAKLLDWGFAVRGKAEPVGRLVDPLPPGATAGPDGSAGTGASGGSAASGAGGGSQATGAGRSGGSGAAGTAMTVLAAAAGSAGLLLALAAGLRVRKVRRDRAREQARARFGPGVSSGRRGGQSSGWG